MADFAAVLRKAVETLKDNTPEARTKVYEKARATIEAKLAAASPPPQVAERQRALLEEAIAKVEAEHAPPPPPPQAEEDDLENLLAELKSGNVQSAPMPRPAAQEAGFGVTAGGYSAPAPQESYVGPDDFSRRDAGDEEAPHGADRSYGDDIDWSRTTQASAGGPEHLPGSAPVPMPVRQARHRRSGGLVAALLLLAVVAGSAVAGWFYRDQAAQFAGFANFDDLVDRGTELARGAPTEEAAPGEAGDEVAAASAPAQQPSPTQQPAEEPQQPTAPPAPEAERPQKFTQRLTADGQEVDEGPAGGEPSVGEGTSVAQATPGTGAPAGQPAGENGTATPDAAQQNVPVGQKAMFYEERTSAASDYAEGGSVVWSVLEESPGENLPPEPVIQAEATIPKKGLQLKMTIRRNADESLPASHIVELIFLTPENFTEGGITNVLRINMKQTEQDIGRPLLGVPAKIADGFFLIALSDDATDQQANATLLRGQNWIDIPVVYTSGRRALITLEKGVPGEEVFNQALDGWARASSG